MIHTDQIALTPSIPSRSLNRERCECVLVNWLQARLVWLHVYLQQAVSEPESRRVLQHAHAAAPNNKVGPRVETSPRFMLRAASVITVLILFLHFFNHSLKLKLFNQAIAGHRRSFNK